jgi:hypothetical protein
MPVFRTNLGLITVQDEQGLNMLLLLRRNVVFAIIPITVALAKMVAAYDCRVYFL